MMFPAGMLLISLMLLRAGLKCVGNDGIDWRGTHCPLRQPRADQRVKFFGSTGSRPKFSEGYCLFTSKAEC